MQDKKKTTNYIPEAQNSKKPLELSENEKVEHFQGLKGEVMPKEKRKGLLKPWEKR